MSRIPFFSPLGALLALSITGIVIPLLEQALTSSAPDVVVIDHYNEEQQPATANASGSLLTQYAQRSVGWDPVPYPIYPNGSRYRIGGEQGMKIIAFETTDSFKVVDDYYQNQARINGYVRTRLMSDFVQYRAQWESRGGNPLPREMALTAMSEELEYQPMSADQPGIIIHRFVNADDALQYGADAMSRTNIIMRYP